MSILSIPGLIDGHVHLREPGGTHKEDVGSGTRAALAGGVLGVLDMPNNSPPTTNRLAFEDKKSRFEKKAVADYGLFAGYGGDDGYLDVASEAVGLKLYLDETFGDLTLREPRDLARIFERWPGPGPIAVHAESASIPRVLELAWRYDRPVHVCHVPHPDDLLRIEEARQRGARITCEVTPHHLFLTRQDVQRLGAYGQMKPPLLPAESVALFWERLNLVDMLATDHAPHTREEKEGDSPPPGVPGLETFLPLMLYAVDEGRLSEGRMLELCYRGPLRVYGLQPPADSEVRISLAGGRYRLPFGGYQTRCGWSPFAHQWALGRVESVRLRGRVVWREGQLLAPAGYGQPLERVGSAQ